MKKVKIMIVDDDLSLTETVSRILEETGLYEILVVNKSGRAFFSARQFRPDLILLDLDMPGKDGCEVARELGEDVTLRDVPIIFLAEADAPAGAGTEQFERRGRHSLSKPVDPKLLLEAVGKMLRGQPGG